VGSSPALKGVLSSIVKVAPTGQISWHLVSFAMVARSD
jgi:hypothetical protein